MNEQSLRAIMPLAAVLHVHLRRRWSSVPLTSWWTACGSYSYAISALLSAYATSYEMLYIARMIGGFAFGAALILAPTYIAEISTAENRGKLVSIQQLNIVLGFFAAFLSNYYLNYFIKLVITF